MHSSNMFTPGNITNKNVNSDCGIEITYGSLDCELRISVIT